MKHFRFIFPPGRVQISGWRALHVSARKSRDGQDGGTRDGSQVSREISQSMARPFSECRK
jgi:hypothetical protein